ncbi:MAG: autotransporter-associated beta strand repeat-containing protein [Opitutaceae bacterium]
MALSALFLIAGSLQTASAASATWTGGGADGNWSTTGNWSPSVPGAASGTANADTATFNNNVNTTVSIDTAVRSIKSISFDTSAGAFTIGSAGANGGNPLNLTTAGQIGILTTFTGTNTSETINAPLVLEPTNGTSAGTYTFLSSGGATNALKIAGGVSGGTTTLGITLTLSGTSTNTGNEISGAISNGNAAGGVSLSKSAAGTWVLSGANTYTGATALSSGILAGIGVHAFGSTSGISVGGGSTLSLRGDADTSFTKASDSSLYALTITANNAAFNVDQATVAGTSAKTMTVGTLNISSAGFTGTTFTGSNNTSLSIGAVSDTAVANSNTQFTNNISGGGALTLASFAGTHTGTAQFILAGTGNTTVTGAITGVQALQVNVTGGGKATLNGISSYSGNTTITAGVLEAAVLANGGSNSSIGSSSNAAASLVFGAPTSTLRYIGSSDVTIDRGLTLSSGVGGGATIESSGTGTLSIDNTVAIAYGTTNQARVLTLGGTNTGANTFSKVLANNTQATSLVKAGAGKWVLGGTNTYTGATTVNLGTLLVNGSIASAVTVNAGTFGGSGSSTKAVTVGTGSGSGAVFAPGNGAVGTFTTTGAVSLLADATYALEFNSSTASFDKIVASGLTLASGAQLTLNDLGVSTALTGGTQYTIFDGTSASVTGTFFGLADGATISNGVNSFTINYNVGADFKDIVLTVAAIPEPSTYALLGALGCLAYAALCRPGRRQGRS